MKRPTQAILLGVVCLTLASALAACGSNSDSDGSGNSSEAKVVSLTPPKSGCGSFTLPEPDDPSGLLTSLPKDMQATFDGYPFPIKKSPWSNWKPKGDPPYTVGVLYPQLTNDFLVRSSRMLTQQLRDEPDIGSVIFKNTGNSVDVAQQLQLFDQMVRNDKPDIIVMFQIQPDAFKTPIEDAGKAGIPVVMPLDSSPSDYAVTVTNNPVKAPAVVASSVVRMMGEKGNMMMVHAFPGSGVDVNAFKGFDAVLKNCPDIKDLGSIYGNFVPSEAKGEALKFLASHPQQIDGALQAAGMGAGVISAFENVGRPVPILGDASATKASLAYWNNHLDDYQAVGATLPITSLLNTLTLVTTKMLAGDGIKTTQVVGDFPLITADTLDQFVDESWTEGTVGDPLGGPNDFLSPSQLNEYFNK